MMHYLLTNLAIGTPPSLSFSLALGVCLAVRRICSLILETIKSPFKSVPRFGGW